MNLVNPVRDLSLNGVKVKCAFCRKEFFRRKGQFNEAKKFDWHQYCSEECQNKAKITRIEKVCGNPDCNNVVSRALNQFKKSKPGLIFCSHSCAIIVNNKKYPRKNGLKPILKTCIVCKNQYKKSSGNKKYCSQKCRKEAKRRTPEDLIKIIKETAEKLKRAPSRRELESINDSCRKLFGSWNNAVLAAGFVPNRSHDDRMYKRANAKATDGHLCDSISEVLIDNWLTKNNISHKRDVSYPTTNHKADWKIFGKDKEIFVEYFGLANDSPRYDRSIKEKEMLCKKQNISLIGIYPKDIYPKVYLDNNLKNKFKDYLVI